MSLISDIVDVGGKLAQRFLTLDDIVAGQGVVGGSIAQLSNAGRLGAGSVLVTSNLAARTVQLGVQAGAKTAKVAAEALEGVVPGADAAVKLAEKVDAGATAAAEEASLLAAHGVQLTGGPDSLPKNPITQDPWIGKECPAGYTWSDLTADTVVGPFGKIALLPLTVGADAAEAVVESRPGRMSVDTSTKTFHGAFEMIGSSGKLDHGELRDALLAVSNRTGLAIVRDFTAIAEAATRFAFGDTRRILRGMNEGLEELRLLAARTDLDELLPALKINAYLRERAQRIVDNPPSHFLAAIAKRPPQVGEVFKSLLEDAGPLQTFIVNYPQVITLLGTSTGLFLAAGLFDVSEIEGFVREKKGAPWSAVAFEDYVGQAVLDKSDPELGYYPESAVYLCQDVSFLYATDVLGREKALARTERLYGKDARERIESDLSLDLKILRAEAGSAREEAIRDRLAEADGVAELRELSGQGQAQLDSLGAFAGARFQYVPRQVTERIDVLRLAVSLANQELALAAGTISSGGGAKPSAGGRRAAQSAFEEWVDGGAKKSTPRGSKAKGK